MEKLEELREIMEKFAKSGWELIAKPAAKWLNTEEAEEALLEAVEQAEAECGSCGCTFDPLYPRALELLREQSA